MKEITLFAEALYTYKGFFGKLPDLYNKEDVDELYSIYIDVCYANENIIERQNRAMLKKEKMDKYPCRNCIYFEVCGDTKRTEKCDGREVITESQAKEFYRDLCGTVYGNANKNCQGIMSIERIADHMEIHIEKAKHFCDAMIKYGITERTNGMIIV